ncbi:MAG: TolC family protein [Candidatus Kapaibacterium sp.]
MDNIRSLLILMLILGAGTCGARENGPEYLIDQAIKHSALKNNFSGYEIINDLESENTRNNYLPGITLQGQAKYQGDVPQVPVNIPNINIPLPPNTQYMATLNLEQLIWDGGVSAVSADMAHIDKQIGYFSVSAGLYSIKENVLNLYFSAIMLDKNLKVLNSSLNELNERKKQVSALVEEGVILESELKEIKIKILQIEQSIRSLKADKSAVIKMLEIRTGLDNIVIDSDNPAEPESDFIQEELNRPEIRQMEAQSGKMKQAGRLAYTEAMPKLSAYVQGGYGNPNPQNFFEDEPSTFYAAGINLQWKLWAWNLPAKKEQIMRVNSEIIENNKKNLIESINMSIAKEKEAINSYRELIQKDIEIVRLREDIKNVKFSQLQNGVINSAEYISAVEAFDKAKTGLELNKVALLRAKYNILQISGNL